MVGFGSMTEKSSFLFHLYRRRINPMPLTEKGRKIYEVMKKEYGSKKSEEVFYASQNKGTIKGTHKKKKK
jgi:hypothetical protein